MAGSNNVHPMVIVFMSVLLAVAFIQHLLISFKVDTKANPPRSIWTHPYEDEQYLHEHPDVREKMRTSISNQELRSSRSDHKQSNYDDRDTRRHSYNGQSSSSSRSPGHNRGFFGKVRGFFTFYPNQSYSN